MVPDVDSLLTFPTDPTQVFKLPEKNSLKVSINNWEWQKLNLASSVADPTFFHPGSEIFSIPDPGSTLKNLSILTPKMFFKL
jgi:hypothetical protein